MLPFIFYIFFKKLSDERCFKLDIYKLKYTKGFLKYLKMSTECLHERMASTSRKCYSRSNLLDRFCCNVSCILLDVSTVFVQLVKLEADQGVLQFPLWSLGVQGTVLE